MSHTHDVQKRSVSFNHNIYTIISKQVSYLTILFKNQPITSKYFNTEEHNQVLSFYLVYILFTYTKPSTLLFIQYNTTITLHCVACASLSIH